MSVPATLTIICPVNVIKDVSAVPLASGKISFQPTDNKDVPIPVSVADGTQVLSEAITRTVSGGAMTGTSVVVPNPASASPQNYRLRITVLDSATQKETVYRNVLIFDAGSGQWSMTNLNAGLASPQIPIVYGAKGDKGDKGDTGNISSPVVNPVVFEDSITTEDGSVISELDTSLLNNQQGLIDATVDADGRLIWGTLPDGTMFFPGGIAGQTNIPLLSADRDGDGFTYYTNKVGAYYHIFRKDDVGNVLQLTSGNYNNLFPAIAANDSFISFITDRSGSFAQYQMDRSGLMQKPLGTDTLALVNLNGVAITGQSLAGGYNTTATTLTQPLDNVMLNGGPRSGSGAGFLVPAANLTSIVPLIEVQGANVSGTSDDVNYGETIASTLANNLAQMCLNNGVRFRMAAMVNAQGNTPYSGIKLGTNPFTNGVTQVTKLHSLAVTAGLTHATRAMALIHGESDEKAGTTNYYANIQQLRVDTVAAHKTATGQDFDFPLFLCQESSWTSYVPSATGTIAYQQLRAMTEQIGLIYLVCPKYFLPYVDNAHITGAGEKWLGEYYARAMYTVLVKRKIWRPIYPRKIARIANKIFIRFWVPEGNSLVIDTTLVTPPTANAAGKYGFEYTDDTAPPSITSVALTPGTTDSVTITLSATPTGSNNRIRYAYTGTSGSNPGPTTGARGNLRDNDTTASTTGQANMYNWCCHFDYAC